MRTARRFTKATQGPLPRCLVAAALCLSVFAIQQAFAADADHTARRAAAVAGTFYPDDSTALRVLIEQLLDQQPAAEAGSTPSVLILPHAGYRYSGIVAARGFREIQGRSYDGVVVVGFTHRQTFRGTSVDDRQAYETPLGAMVVDRKAVDFLLEQPGVRHVERAHAGDEHSLEVMLPFLQVALPNARLVPLLMGSVARGDAQMLAEALAGLAQRGEYLFIFSTDLSHDHPYDTAAAIDRRTVQAILSETPEAVNRLLARGELEACGRGPIVASLFLSERLGYLERRLLSLKNSGDTAGEKDRVVGYAAIEMSERDASATEDLISQQAGVALVGAARDVLESHFLSGDTNERDTNERADVSSALVQGGLASDAVKDGQLSTASPNDQMKARGDALALLKDFSELAQAMGLFVTLRRRGTLRGCIGRTESDIPLRRLLSTVALDAALRDARFDPVVAQELDELTIEVSVLSPPHAVASPDEILPGRDGVILEYEDKRGVFLPIVWASTAWTRKEFLTNLAQQKAGLPPDAWQRARLLTFQDHTFEEESPSFSGSPH